MPAILVNKAPLIEVFSSIQGEGVLLGTRQIFIRFAECNLDCKYCDTPYEPGKTCRIETAAGSGVYIQADNPVDLTDITSLVTNWHGENDKLHHSLVLTGGEPLIHAEVLKAWLPEVRLLLPVFLETNGTLPDQLEKVLSLVDMISMDIKGGATSGAATPWDAHCEFMLIAGERLCQVKLVVDSTTRDEEILQAARLAHRNAPGAPFILQPRTLRSGLSLSGEALLLLQKVASTEHSDARVIPQVHPWLGVA